jgi:hypothetical protein
VKKYILSVIGGCIIGILLAYSFILLVPHLPAFFEKVFFDTVKSPVKITQDVFDTFIPPTDQYIIESVDQAIPVDKKVVYADLGAMKILTYENGELVTEFPIQSVGREGTAWQTPLGTFDMSYKLKSHFSSIGHVYMPFSMHFFGNYFIHGWPYYPDGTPVGKGYSGGCIRLNTSDAEQIFNFVDNKTELIIVNSTVEIPKQTELQYQIENEAPQLESSYLVVDIATSEVVATQGGKDQMPIGSFSKLMTALISLESLNQYQHTFFGQNTATIADLLYPLLLANDDEAGTLLYEHKNKAQYLIDMNTRALSLGMGNTTYTDINGMSSSTVSTLEDSYRLIRYFYIHKQFILKVLSLGEYKIADTTYDAIHPLRDSAEYVGGFADDTHTELFTLMNVDIEGQKKTFALLVGKSAHTDQDTKQLYEWMKGNVVMRK